MLFTSVSWLGRAGASLVRPQSLLLALALVGCCCMLQGADEVIRDGVIRDGNSKEDAAAPSAGDDKEKAAAETAKKRKLQQQLTSTKTSERLQALDRLRNQPSVESAKLIVTRGLKDRDEGVRQAAEDALLAGRDNPEVCEFLIDVLAKDGRRKGGLAPLYPVYRTLLASNLPDAEEGLFNYFEKATLNQPEAIVAMSDLADDLGKKAMPSEFPRLERLTRSKVYSREFGLRRAVVEAATRYTTKPAVAFLFQVLAADKGEIRGEIVEYLMQVTGEKFGADTAAWAKWWQANEKTFEYPQRAAPPILRNMEVAGTGSYYGIPLYAQRLVFVIDTSGSMRGARIVAAKRDLSAAISGLDENVYFSVVSFNSGVFIWQAKLVPATLANKRMANYWVENQDLGPGTASYDGLEAALRFDAEAIYFLTDGAPYGGKIVMPRDIIDAISHMHRVRRESIYSIGIGVGPEGSVFDLFLKTLAEENYGLYRRVDE